MSNQGIAFLDRWITEHVTEGLKQAVDENVNRR